MSTVGNAVRLRATAAGTLLVGVLAGTVSAAAPATAGTGFVPGTGTSSAGVARIQMRSSGAAIGFGLGVARSRFAGAQGNAEAASVDLGLFDTLSKAPLACGYSMGALLPPGLVPAKVLVSSADGATEKRTASAGEGGPLQLGSQYGAATPNASATATVDGVSLDLPGVLRVVGGTASSTAKLVPGSQRQSTGAGTLTELSLAGGLVDVQGMRWTAADRTGAESDSTAGFSAASFVVSGRSLPTADAAELREAVAAANAALSPTGLSLQAPDVARNPDGIAVSPLRVSVSATPALRAALGAALVGIQPLRTQLLSFVAPLQAGPDCGLARALGFGYLAIDLATLAIGDGGAVDLDLGGAAAGTDATAYANPFDSGFGLIHPGAPVSFPGPTTGPPVPLPNISVGGPTVPTSDSGAAPLPASAPAGTPISMAATSTQCRSLQGGDCTSSHGRLAAWIVLLLIAVLAAADRLRTRLT